MKILAVLALVLSGASAAAAAEIHGTLSDGGKPVPKGVALKLECGGATTQAATDEFGSYSLKTAAAGECRLSVDYQGSSGSTTVAVYDRPSRYDFALGKDGGKLVLTRK